MLDVRLPIGLLLGAIGLVLVATGAALGEGVTRGGVNLDLACGAALIAAAAGFLALAWRARSRQPGGGS